MDQAAVAAPGAARPGYFFEDLTIGMSAEYRRAISDEEMRLFADLTGDTNPLHFDDDFAAQSRFGGRIVHGMCTASFISTVIGTRMPGPGSIYLSQTLRFTAPVRPGDEVVARAVVDRLIPERQARRIRDDLLRRRAHRADRPGAGPGPLPRRAGLEPVSHTVRGRCRSGVPLPLRPCAKSPATPRQVETGRWGRAHDDDTAAFEPDIRVGCDARRSPSVRPARNNRWPGRHTRPQAQQAPHAWGSRLT